MGVPNNYDSKRTGHWRSAATRTPFVSSVWGPIPGVMTNPQTDLFARLCHGRGLSRSLSRQATFPRDGGWGWRSEVAGGRAHDGRGCRSLRGSATRPMPERPISAPEHTAQRLRQNPVLVPHLMTRRWTAGDGVHSFPVPGPLSITPAVLLSDGTHQNTGKCHTESRAMKTGAAGAVGAYCSDANLTPPPPSHPPTPKMTT